MRELVCINGRLLEADKATVSVFDPGFMQGIGLFETMRAYGGVAFRLEEHIDRLRSSAGKLSWNHVPDEEDLRANIEEVVRAAGVSDCRVRLTVTTGSVRTSPGELFPFTIVASVTETATYPDEYYLKGVTLVPADCYQAPWDATVGHKTTSYYGRIAALREAASRSAFDGLWTTPEGDIAEASISNVFVVKDDLLLTPPLDTPVLPGITRKAILEAAAKLRIGAEERPISLEEFLQADEAFLTNSMMEVMPVVRLERQPIGDEKVGEVTRALGLEYKEMVARECKIEAGG
jgi:branched-subunit amino acid aminotransferase/4-amino-4-deoxychorismate lyase